MSSPRLEAAAASTRTEADLRAARRERFIASQLTALRDIGLPQSALAREEALLRGGFAATTVFAALLEPR